MLGIKSIVHIGSATYIGENTSFTWEHSWVTDGEIIIDGNVDTMLENPAVPIGINPDTYWGCIDKLPSDRKLISNRVLSISDELDALDDSYIQWKSEIKKFMKSNNLIN